MLQLTGRLTLGMGSAALTAQLLPGCGGDGSLKSLLEGNGCFALYANADDGYLYNYFVCPENERAPMVDCEAVDDPESLTAYAALYYGAPADGDFKFICVSYEVPEV